MKSRNQECTIAVIEMLKEQGKIAIDDKFIKTLKITQAKEDEHNIIKKCQEPPVIDGRHAEQIHASHPVHTGGS